MGVTEKYPKVTYLIFLTGFHWRISLLSRANRLCTVFNAGLKDLGVLRVSVFLSLARSKMAIVRLPRDLPKNFLFCIYFRWGEGNPTSIWGPPANHLASFFFPLPMSGYPRSLKCEHLHDPHSLLTVTFWLLDNVSSTGGEYHSHLLVSVSHHVTIVIQHIQMRGLPAKLFWSDCMGCPLEYCVLPKSSTCCYLLLGEFIYAWVNYELYKVKLVTFVEGDPQALFSIASTSRCREGCYSFPWIAPLYSWCLPYNAEC